VDIERIEELLRQYGDKREEGASLPPEADSRIKSRLRDLAGRDSAMFEQAKRRSVRRRTMLKGTVLIAASLIVILTFVFFNRFATWKVHCIPLDSMTRGKPAQFQFEIWPSFEGYLYILQLDLEQGFRFIFPYLDANGLDDYGLSGPFSNERTYLIPPDDYEGFPIVAKDKGGLYFIIPMRRKLSERELRTLIQTLKSGIVLDQAGPDQVKQEVVEYLRISHPFSFSLTAKN
jgi:hypothetical protein